MNQKDVKEVADVILEKSGDHFKLVKHRDYETPLSISKQAAVHLLDTGETIYIVGGKNDDIQ